MDVTKEIPKAEFAIIGGSVLRPIHFPEDLHDPDVEVVAPRMVFQTPLGDTIPFKLLKFNQGDKERYALYARYLGVRSDETRLRDTEQVFWVFREAGVLRILTEDCMGSLNPLMEPGDIVITHDFIDLHKHASVLFMPGQLVRMRAPYCTEIQALLVQAAENAGFRRVYGRGVYAVSHGTRFESPAEISMYRQLGGDLVGYSLVPAIYLARAIKACYSGIYVIANYGEGILTDWDHDKVWDRTHEVTPIFGKILLDMLKELPVEKSCNCDQYITPRPPEIVDYPDR
jgi:5'-methylthioadenosine phosphorylase